MKKNTTTFWILLILLVVGVVAFASTVTSAADPTTMWALLSANFIFYLGLTQAAIIFSTIMGLVKSPWGAFFSRLGEVITLSFIPVAIVMFLALYLGGFEHLFYWADTEAVHAQGLHVSPWLTERLFLVRSILSNALFYILSFAYFRMGRKLERDPHSASPTEHCRVTLGCFVMFAFIVVSTFISWDFGMTAIKHWESSIYAPTFWVGNLIAGFSFLFLMALAFIPRGAGGKLEPVLITAMAKVLFGFVLLWIYMYWSQHIIFWYGNVPARMNPAFKMMWQPNTKPFILMILLVFVIPFIMLIFRSVKTSANAMAVVASIICVGIWINRYLLIVPIYTGEGDVSVLATGTGIFITIASGAATILSIYAFRRFFPSVTLTTGMKKSGH